jgi:DNA sulfur modification protein DndB
MKPSEITIPGIKGVCGRRDVFMGFAPANFLHSISFADVLNEHTGEGYQRKFNQKHSLDFRKYIRTADSSTIPLTFNLRPESEAWWKVQTTESGQDILKVVVGKNRILSQVDCQHRLGSLAELDIPLAFMTFIGLPLKDEIGLFSVINSKAKGLNASLLDFHETKLLADVAKERPEIYIAIRLHDDEKSPWFKQLDLGGTRIIGLTRRASLRTIQSAVKRFLRKTGVLNNDAISIEDAYLIVRHFWSAVAELLEAQWRNQRKHFITKGIGVYALMELGADLYLEASSKSVSCDQDYFRSILSDFICDFDWSHTGPLKGLGGQTGASEAHSILVNLRKV